MTYYYLYKTRDILNNKEYIGVHKTNNLRDGYIGSGITSQKSALRKAKEQNTPFINAVAKHGYDNFIKEVLQYFNSYEEALKKEAEIVNKEYALSNHTYNVKTGGQYFENLSLRKTYSFTDFEGNLHVGDNIKQFCEEKALDYTSVLKLISKKSISSQGYFNTEDIKKVNKIIITNVMTNTIYETYDLHRWCKKYLPELVSKDGKNNSLNEVLKGRRALAKQEWWACYKKDYKGYIQYLNKKPKSKTLKKIKNNG